MQKKHTKIIIGGGGSGGHIYPAIAIADALKKRIENVNIMFVGAKGRLEMYKVPEAGYFIKGLWISGIRRGSIWKNAILPFKLLHSLFKCWLIVVDFKPKLAIGVGGYASWPLLRVAVAKNIPILIQEQNGYAGFTNKILAKRAKKICVAYPDMEKHFPKKKIVFTGNPIRGDMRLPEFRRKKAYKYFDLDPKRPTILIFGGSGGCLVFNEAVVLNAEKWLEKGYQLLWITGNAYYNRYRDDYKNKNYRARGLVIIRYSNKMNYAYLVADLVIARAGALSISELALTQKATILVPSPHVVQDHQTKNASALAEESATLMILDHEVKAKLGDEVIRLMEDTEERISLAKRIGIFAKPNAADAVVDEIIKLIS